MSSLKRKKSGNQQRKIQKAYLDLVDLGTDDGTHDSERKSLVTVRSEADESRIAVENQEGSVPVFFSSTENEDIYGRYTLNEDEKEEGDEENIIDFFQNKKSDDLQSQIKKWAIENNVTHSALKALMAILNNHLPNSLPADPRTLMRTPREIVITQMDSGEYWHNGFTATLTKIVKIFLEKQGKLNKVSLCFNIDGLPIYNSSKHQFWPILCRIFEYPAVSPIIVGIYAGLVKPRDLNAYLLPFIEELIVLLENSIEIGTNKVTVEVKCFVCDSPARAMIKGVQNFNGKHGCQKCTIVGEYSHVSHTVIFPGVNYPPRNDEDFRRNKYGGHHKMHSPILKLPIDIVEDFPVADSLHLIDLGVMKRLLIGWRDGNLGKKDTKWRASDIRSVNEFLNTCKTPTEIHRSVRGIDHLAHWKGSEFRTFLLYLSVVILNNILNPAAMNHFLSFFCAVTICLSEEYFQYLHLAKDLFIYFVTHFKFFYGEDYITSNIHNLTHVVDEVQRFGKLQNFSAYPFENRLFFIKKLLRQGNRPLAQVAKRLAECTEVEFSNITEFTEQDFPFVKENKRDHDLVLHFNGFILSAKESDSYFLSNSGDVLKIRRIKIRDAKIRIKCHKIEGKTAVFQRPINSANLNIYKCESVSSTPNKCIYLPKDVKCKLVAVPYKSELYFLPLLHTL